MRPVHAAPLVLLLAAAARAMVNPSLQPVDLYERNDVVLNLKLQTIDEDARTMRLAVVDVPKGRFEAKHVVMRLSADEAVKEAFLQRAGEGMDLVAYVSPKRRGRPAEIRFYLADGVWGTAVPLEADPATWEWTEVLDPQGSRSMFGTFNGRGDRLAEMMRDVAVGSAFFPATVNASFAPQRLIGRAPAPASGLAIYDLNADGQADLLATSAQDLQVFIQTQPGVFEERAAAMGLADARGVGIDVADVNADGLPDLLVGTTIHLQRAGNVFEPTTLIADALADNKKGAAKSVDFCEFNGDGYADVLISWSGGGLSVLIHRGKDETRYVDRTAEMLAGVEGIAAGDGMVVAGDWDRDGRDDLFYSIDSGLLLVQDRAGRFARMKGTPRCDFSSRSGKNGQTGGGVFAPLWTATGADLMVASEANMNFISQDGEEINDVTGYANEITESEMGLTSALAEDLDADGNVDVYALNGGGFANFLYINRGYGSFMAPQKYVNAKQNPIFPGPAHASGSTAAVAGDVNGDGAADLFLASKDGELNLFTNACLAKRRLTPHPTQQQKFLDEASLLRIWLNSPAHTIGAAVEVINPSNQQMLARRTVAHQDAPNSRGPDTICLTMRHRGQMLLRVRWSDGKVSEMPITLAATDKPVTIEVKR